MLSGASKSGRVICSTRGEISGSPTTPIGISDPTVSIKRTRSFLPRHESKSKLETVNDLTLKKPADVSSSVGCECHSSLIAAKTFGSHATACCEPCPNSSAPFPTVTLAAKVDSMNGTIPIITVPRRILFLYRPEPPKPDVTLPLSGEFNPPAIVESFHSKTSPNGLRTNGVRILIPAQVNKQTAVKPGWLNQRFIGMSPFLKSKVIPRGEILVFVIFLGAP